MSATGKPEEKIHPNGSSHSSSLLRQNAPNFEPEMDRGTGSPMSSDGNPPSTTDMNKVIRRLRELIHTNKVPTITTSELVESFQVPPMKRKRKDAMEFHRVVQSCLNYHVALGNIVESDPCTYHMEDKESKKTFVRYKKISDLVPPPKAKTPDLMIPGRKHRNVGSSLLLPPVNTNSPIPPPPPSSSSFPVTLSQHSLLHVPLAQSSPGMMMSKKVNHVVVQPANSKQMHNVISGIRSWTPPVAMDSIVPVRRPEPTEFIPLLTVVSSPSTTTSNGTSSLHPPVAASNSNGISLFCHETIPEETPKKKSRKQKISPLKTDGATVTYTVMDTDQMNKDADTEPEAEEENEMVIDESASNMDSTMNEEESLESTPVTTPTPGMMPMHINVSGENRPQTAGTSTGRGRGRLPISPSGLSKSAKHRLALNRDDPRLTEIDPATGKTRYVVTAFGEVRERRRPGPKPNTVYMKRLKREMSTDGTSPDLMMSPHPGGDDKPLKRKKKMSQKMLQGGGDVPSTEEKIPKKRGPKKKIKDPLMGISPSKLDPPIIITKSHKRGMGKKAQIRALLLQRQQQEEAAQARAVQQADYERRVASAAVVGGTRTSGRKRVRKHLGDDFVSDFHHGLPSAVAGVTKVSTHTTTSHTSAKASASSGVASSRMEQVEDDKPRRPTVHYVQVGPWSRLMKNCSTCKLGHRSMTGKRQMLRCSECGRSQHPVCANLTADQMPRILQTAWTCMDCKECCMCTETDKEEENLFLCDSCDLGYHAGCHPGRRTDLEDNEKWFCFKCVHFYGRDSLLPPHQQPNGVDDNTAAIAFLDYTQSGGCVHGYMRPYVRDQQKKSRIIQQLNSVSVSDVNYFLPMETLNKKVVAQKRLKNVLSQIMKEPLGLPKEDILLSNYKEPVSPTFKVMVSVLEEKYQKNIDQFVKINHPNDNGNLSSDQLSLLFQSLGFPKVAHFIQDNGLSVMDLLELESMGDSKAQMREYGIPMGQIVKITFVTKVLIKKLMTDESTTIKQ